MTATLTSSQLTVRKKYWLSEDPVVVTKISNWLRRLGYSEYGWTTEQTSVRLAKRDGDLCRIVQLTAVSDNFFSTFSFVGSFRVTELEVALNLFGDEFPERIAASRSARESLPAALVTIDWRRFFKGDAGRMAGYHSVSDAFAQDVLPKWQDEFARVASACDELLNSQASVASFCRAYVFGDTNEQAIALKSAVPNGGDRSLLSAAILFGLEGRLGDANECLVFYEQRTAELTARLGRDYVGISSRQRFVETLKRWLSQENGRVLGTKLA